MDTKPSDSLASPTDYFRLDGLTVLVTGASSGLGVRFTRLVHAVGANVVIAARRADRLAALAAELPGTLAITADLAQAEERERLVAEALERVGAIDVLVNNAGVGGGVAIEDETLEQFRASMELNTTAVWHMSKLCAPAMIAKGGGSIVNVASIMGHVASAPLKEAHYCASKGAVVNLTREMAVQWARKGVRVNALCPGFFLSEMTAGMDTDPGSQRFITNNCPIPRLGHAHELDAALLFLAGPGSTFYTGQSLIVDGGWTAR